MLTIEDKIKICDLVKNGRSLTSVAAEFNYPNISLIQPLQSQRVRISDSLLYYLSLLLLYLFFLQQHPYFLFI